MAVFLDENESRPYCVKNNFIFLLWLAKYFPSNLIVSKSLIELS